MISFLDKVIQYCGQKNEGDWENTTLFFPNNRSGYYFQDKLKKQLAVGAFLPTITTLERFVKDNTSLYSLSPTDITFELFKTYKKNYTDTSLKHFLPVAKTLLNDFNELNSELLDIRIFFRNLQQLKSMNVYMEEDEEKAFKYKYFWETVEQCYQGLEVFCEEKKGGYTGLQYRDVAENIAQISLADERYFFVGFTQLSASEKKIVQYFLDKKEMEYLIDTDEFYIKDKSKTAGISYRKISQQLKLKGLSFVENLIATEPKNIHIYACNGKYEQIQTLQNLLKGNEEILATPKETAVILPDPSMLAPLLSNLPTDFADANISMGWSMSHSLIYRNIVAIQQCLHYAKVFGEQRFFHVNNLKQLFELGLVEEGNRLSYELKKEKKIIYISTKKLSQLIKRNETLVDLLCTDSAIDDFKTNLQKWINDLRSTNEEERIFINECKEIIVQTNGSVSHIDWLSVDDYLLLLTDNLAAHQLPFDVDPTKGLQIMGPMESRNLDFENVFILSMNEGNFPTSSKQNSYIPIEIRMAYLTPPIEKDAISTYLFYRLLHRSKNMHLLYNNQEKMAGGEVSRFILQARFELSKLENINVHEYDVMSNMKHTEETHTIIQKDEKMLDSIATYFSKGVSPSALKSYINCSLQFYYSYILGIRPADEAEETIEASLLGSTIHNVLEALYTPFVGKNITPTDVERMLTENNLELMVRANLATSFDENLLVGKNYLLLKVAVKLIHLFLKNELALASANDLRIHSLEEELSIDVTIHKQAVKFRGFADRIDELDGTIRIADYKTGTPTKTEFKIDDFDSVFNDPKKEKLFQLLMYGWMYAKKQPTAQNIVSGIYWLKKTEENFASLLLDGEPLLTKELLTLFEQKLTELILEIANKDLPFEMTEDTKRCTYCDYKNLCNRN